MTLETSGGTAESNAGIGQNMIPKEGGNMFHGSFETLYSNDRMQSSNLSDAVRARGLTTVPKFLYNRDFGGTLGGPIKRDRLWFFTVQRWWGQRNEVTGVYYNKTQHTPFYTPDLNRPADRFERFESHVARLTWQASQKNKVNVFVDVAKGLQHFNPENTAPEAHSVFQYYPLSLYQVTWSSPRTNRLLFEAGASATIAHYKIVPRAELGVTLDDIAMVDLSTGFRYNALGLGGSPYGDRRNGDRYVQRGAASYVTGSHAFKVGFQLEEANKDIQARRNGDVIYQFLGTVPTSIIQFAAPDEQWSNLKADLGIYAQDQWTLKRLTLNMGLRYDYLNAYVPAQHLGAGQFVPARDFAPVYGVPRWKDLNPRVGAVYDLFGNTKTALKVSMGRYVSINSTDIAEANNPVQTSVNSVTRTWSDLDGNYVPDCDLRTFTSNGECGAISNLNFGKPNITTRWADDVLRGFGVRPYSWDFVTEVQHDLGGGMALSGGFFRTWSGNFRVTDNLAVTPADHSTFCLTAPANAALPGGGGYPVCGLADVSLAKFGQVDNLITQASQYGTQTQVANFFNVNLNARLGSGIRLAGGVDTGRTVTDNCFVIDSPQQLVNCHVVQPFEVNTQVKLNGSYPLPGDFTVSGVFQNVPGPTILANYPAPNTAVAPALGRNLAACGTRPVCTATATVPLTIPYSQFEGRRTQLDVRLTKHLGLGSKARLQANVDLYNVLNGNAILSSNPSYGAQWRRPLVILSARLIQFSGQLTF